MNEIETSADHSPSMGQASELPDDAQKSQRVPLASCATGAVEESRLLPSGCGCGGQSSGISQAMQKVYALGQLGFDYGTRQRRQYFQDRFQQNRAVQDLNHAQGLTKDFNPDDPSNLVAYLTSRPYVGKVDPDGSPVLGPDGKPIFEPPKNGQDPRSLQYTILNGGLFDNRADVASLTWFLKIDETPIYAIAPAGPFASDVHDTLVQFLLEQVPPPKDSGRVAAERMAVAGIIVGETRLYTGERIPVIQPDQRSLANWTTDALLDAIRNISGDSDPDPIDQLRELLFRMYELTRNLGVSSQDRALNYAATDALALQNIFSQADTQAVFKGMELDTVTVEKSPICRPDYDCWDVSIIFYDPNLLTRARRGIRYTVDVSDVLPNILANSQRPFSLR